MTAQDPAGATPSHAIREQIRSDVELGRTEEVVTRFPPEPNGHLHIGHALSICLNFGMAAEFSGRCNLRFDDTNPLREDQAYIDAIQRDVAWLGFSWSGEARYASDYFEQLYAWAQHLIDTGHAYVDDLSAEDIRAWRGTLTEPGRDSPWRNRSADESLALFRRMRDGDFPDGARVLRARIDMASGNINLRDPVLYRILHAEHPRTGRRWCIYPTYDFAHGQSDAIEGVSHSLCTLEFADHRPLYDWLLEHLPVPSRPRQYEFAKLALSHTILSKRRLTRLVEDGHVQDWDDPRLATLSGLRRRGVPPAALREFVSRLAVSRNEGVVDIAMFEHVLRDTLNRSAERRMAVLRPLKVVIESFEEGRTDWLEAANHPADPDAGTRQVPFSREVWIERDDFMEDPPRRFHRLAPGREVRLRYGYLITCTEVVRDASGNVTELRCRHDPASRGGTAPDGRKVRGTIHWVSAAHAVDAEVRLYGPLVTTATPGATGDFVDDLDRASLEILRGCKLEPVLAGASGPVPVQFERLGYFSIDPDSAPGAPVYNQTVSLRDSWAKDRAKS
ncbi:MAG: glutamine--tRNA ligase/YqeY domain fusion protein [Alphaproteobacteria bacterium]|nr:glutamine--tRNA ligase/YqeY domain fusion protein [Alphaproteobacteria bacterium]